jgi:hypothetical protein
LTVASCGTPIKKASSPITGATFGTCQQHPTKEPNYAQTQETVAVGNLQLIVNLAAHWVQGVAQRTHVVSDHSSHFLVVVYEARAMVHEGKLPCKVVLFEDLLVRHEEDQLQLHYQCVEELRVTAIENLPPHSASINKASVLAV